MEDRIIAPGAQIKETDVVMGLMDYVGHHY